MKQDRPTPGSAHFSSRRDLNMTVFQKRNLIDHEPFIGWVSTIQSRRRQKTNGWQEWITHLALLKRITCRDCAKFPDLALTAGWLWRWFLVLHLFNVRFTSCVDWIRMNNLLRKRRFDRSKDTDETHSACLLIFSGAVAALRGTDLQQIPLSWSPWLFWSEIGEVVIQEWFDHGIQRNMIGIVSASDASRSGQSSEPWRKPDCIWSGESYEKVTKFRLSFGGVLNESRFLNWKSDQLRHRLARIPDYCMQNTACKLLQWASQNQQ